MDVFVFVLCILCLSLLELSHMHQCSNRSPHKDWGKEKEGVECVREGGKECDGGRGGLIGPRTGSVVQACAESQRPSWS